MSNATCSAADRDQILSEYAGSLSTVYMYLMVPTVLGTLLLPFLFALFYFSNSTQRHTPIFVLVTFAIILCLAQSIQQATIHMRMLYNPVDTTSKVFPHAILISTLILELLPNWVADLALLYRILAVYPRSTTPTHRLALIITPPIIFKLVRVACWIGFLIALTRPGGQLPHFLWTKEERWWTVVERLFTAVDNTYATAFFLWKLRGALQFKNDVYRYSSTGQANSVGSRIRALFWLSATNFVIPVPLCFLQVGFAAALPNSIVYEIVQHFINFVSVVCVAFATVWYSTATLRSSLREDAKSSPVPSALRFQRSNTTGSPRSSADSEMGLSTGRMSRKYSEKHSRPVRVDWTLPTPMPLDP